MAEEVVQAVVRRALEDPAFWQWLHTDPQAALADYPLSPAARAALLRLAPQAPTAEILQARISKGKFEQT